MRSHARVSLSCSAESIERIKRFFGCFARNTMQKAHLMKMRSEQGSLPGFNCFLIGQWVRPCPVNLDVGVIGGLTTVRSWYRGSSYSARTILFFSCDGDHR